MPAQINLGFVPLTDSAPLIVAQALGYFRQFELDVILCPQNSWSTLRDKLQTGLLDAAQLLAPMPLASSLGLGGMKVQMTVPMVLSQNGNAISLSRVLCDEILSCNELSTLPFPMPSSLLTKIVQRRAVQGKKKLCFATVFPYSCHQYQLLDWLKEAGVHNDIDVITIPPSEMSSSLESGFIDGFCVGGPWSAKSVREGTGVTVLTSYHIWQDKAEKVLGVTEDFYYKEPQLIAKLSAALLLACEWLQHLPNRFEAAKLMSESGYLNEPIEVIAPSLLGSCLIQQNQSPENVPHYNRFYQSNFMVVNSPTLELQQWLLQKMIDSHQISSNDAEQSMVTQSMQKIVNTACFDQAITLLAKHSQQ
ncbi:MAG: ABC-type nitrate/sulfonate/bicarbonate transport system substrate-binding protein [Gammaproteobacteria bacterium]|jgi:ABC-type nitrate/sulfonate/bicarbonate transport system substrate-binding protein